MTEPTVVGLEVHVQLRTRTKLFCGCAVEFGAAPNTHVCPVCLGLPGALPATNAEAVRLALRAALALGFRVEPTSEFVRKQYFYPDLPKGYQITQYADPLARDGEVRLPEIQGGRRVRLRQLQLEEDAGKSIHDRFEGSSAVDFNRCGVPLIEVVTEPDLRSPSEARAFLVRLKQILQHYAGVSDCNMEEGSLRVDANISVDESGSGVPSPRIEVKNLNSFANVERALVFEQRRLSSRVGASGSAGRETRLWDAGLRETRVLRAKEEVLDYRYMPEPDLPLLEPSGDQTRQAARDLPPPASEVEMELMTRHGLSGRDAWRLAASPQRAAYLEAVAGDAGGEVARTAGNLMMGDLAAELNRRGLGSEADLMPPETLRRLVELRLDGTLSSDTASRALTLLLRQEGRGASDLDELVEREGLRQVGDEATLRGWILEALSANPGAVRRYRQGQHGLLDHLMGEVMRASAGRADPAEASRLLKDALSADE